MCGGVRRRAPVCGVRAEDDPPAHPQMRALFAESGKVYDDAGYEVTLRGVNAGGPVRHRALDDRVQLRHAAGQRLPLAHADLPRTLRRAEDEGAVGGVPLELVDGRRFRALRGHGHERHPPALHLYERRLSRRHRPRRRRAGVRLLRDRGVRQQGGGVRPLYHPRSARGVRFAERAGSQRPDHRRRRRRDLLFGRAAS